jgi:hypothetical protein
MATLNPIFRSVVPKTPITKTLDKMTKELDRDPNMVDWVADL